MIFKRSFIKDNERELAIISKFQDLELGRQADIGYMKDCRLSFVARGIMAYYFTHIPNWKPLEKSSKYVVSQAIKELIEFGYLSRTKKGDTWAMVAYEVALDNPSYDPYRHGMAYCQADGANDTLDDLILTQLFLKNDIGVAIAEDNFDDILKPGLHDDSPKEAKSKSKPKDHLEHVMMIKKSQYEALSGAPYSDYAIKIHNSFNGTKELIDPHKVKALGAFLYAYNQVTGKDKPIPGATSDKKYWGKIAGKHLDNYSLNQLAPMYILAITLQSADGLDILTPDSVSKYLVKAYEILTQKAKRKAETKSKIEAAKIEAAKAAKQGMSYEEQIGELVELTLNKASGKSGKRHNSPHMWKGFIFDNETDYNSVLDYYENWKFKIDQDTEGEIRDLLAQDSLKLINPLSMNGLGDLFHFRTAQEDKLLFRAYILTNRAINPNFDPIALRLDKTTPLPDDLETCELPDFYKSLIPKVDMPVRADSILAQFENLETLSKMGEN